LETGITIATVGTLFPAIPLAIVALNFRYTSLAGLMRNISSQIEMPEVNQSRQNILNQELIVMRKRMVMVKYSLFLAGMSFILNLCALFASYYGHQEIAPNFMGLTIIALIFSMLCFCLETSLSTKALDLHISKLK
jgi:ABC-type multidrug transport system permease subunit